MSFDKDQFRRLVVQVQAEMDLSSTEARATPLLMGTCAVETEFGTYLRQLGYGPALGCMQIEPATFKWLLHKYWKQFPLIRLIRFEQLEWDVRASIIFARLRYLADKQPLPESDDMLGLARTWKRVYNTIAGAGTVADFLEKFKQYCK